MAEIKMKKTSTTSIMTECEVREKLKNMKICPKHKIKFIGKCPVCTKK